MTWIVKKLDTIFLALTLALLVCTVSVLGDVVTPLPDADFWGELLKFLGSIKGQTTMGIVAALVQLAMMFFRTSMGDLAGVWKWVIVSGLSMVGVLLASMAAGNSFLVSITSGAVLAAFQVWLHQLIKTISDAKEAKMMVSGR